jgi:hypothetical protein
LQEQDRDECAAQGQGGLAVDWEQVSHHRS